MAADEFVNHVLDILGSIGEVETARFFGGSAIRLAGVQFAMIMQGTLYFVVSDALREQFQALGSQPFSYDTKHGPRAIHRYYTVPEELLDPIMQTLMVDPVKLPRSVCSLWCSSCVCIGRACARTLW